MNRFARGVVTSACHAAILLKGFGRGVELKMARAGKKTREDVLPKEKYLGKMPRHQMLHRCGHLRSEICLVRSDQLQVKVGMLCDVPEKLVKRIGPGFAQHAHDGKVMIKRAQVACRVKRQRGGLRTALPVRERVEFRGGGLKVSHSLFIILIGAKKTTQGEMLIQLVRHIHLIRYQKDEINAFLLKYQLRFHS